MKHEEFVEIFRKTPVAIVVSSPDGYILECTDFTLRLVGRKREELIGKYFLDLTPVEDIENSIRLFRKLVKGEIDSYSITKSYVLTSGERIPVISKVFAIRDDNEKLKYAIVLISRKEDSNEIRKQALIYKYVFKKTSVPLALLSKEGIIVNANEAFLKIFFNMENALYSNVWSIFQNEVVVEQQLKKFFSSNQDRIEIHGKFKNSKSYVAVIEKIEDSNFYLLSISEGPKVEFANYPKLTFNLPTSDVFETLSLKLFKDKNSVYRRVYNKFDTIVLLSKDLTIKELDLPQELFESRVRGDEVNFYVNKTPIRDEIIFSSNSVDDIDKKVLNKHISEVFKEEAVPVIENFVIDYLEDKVKEFWVDIPETNDRKFFEVRGDKKEEEYLILIRDITPHKKYEELLEKEKELLMQELLEKKRFWATISHEIRTPLHSIIGFLQLLYQTELTQTQKEYLDIVKVSSENLLSLINDILEFSKLESQGEKIEEEEINLCDEVNSVVSVVLSKIKNKSIRIVEDFDLNIPCLVISDKYKFRRILLNIVDNAVKFSPNYSDVVISVQLVEEGEEFCRIKFSVRDFGIGIPQEKLNDIFKPFSQLDNELTRRYQGTGLGLAICKKLVDLLGGTIEVTSQVGKGSIFTFYLPFKKVSNEDLRKRIGSELDKMSFCIFVHKGLLPSLLKFPHPKVVFFRYIDELESILRDDSFVLFNDLYVTLDDLTVLKGLKEKFKNVKFALLKEPFLDLDISLEIFDFVIEKNESIFKILEFITGHVKEKEYKDLKDTLIKVLKDRNLKVLVVEDNVINSMFISKVLEGIGVNNVDLVSHSRNALERIKKYQYDIIFLDVQMPDIDGFTLAREIRKLSLVKNPIIIGVSAQAFKEDIQEGLRSGMNDYLTKPVQIQKIYEVIAKYVLNENIDSPLVSGKFEEGLISEESIERLKSITSKEEFPKFINSLLNAFVEEFDKEIKRLVLAYKSNDLKEVKKIAHKLRGSCYELGFTKLGNIFTEIENNANEGKSVVDEKFLAEIELIKRDTLEAIKQFY
ncbi:MAG: ATP-binding protein [Brevinematia bacterium]